MSRHEKPIIRYEEVAEHYANGQSCPWCHHAWATNAESRCGKCKRVNSEGTATLYSTPTPIICPSCDYSFKVKPEKSIKCPRCEVWIPGKELIRVYGTYRERPEWDDVDAFKKSCFENGDQE